jgi:hypothetical protein
MTLAEIQAWLKEHEAEAEVKNYLAGLTKVTPEGVTAYLSTDDGKKFIQPTLDAYFSKGLETWKTNNLDKLVNEKYEREHPAEDERDKQIRELTNRLDSADREKARANLRANAITKATSKGLPIEIIDYVIGEDEATTESNLTRFETAFTTAVNAKVEERFKSGGGNPKPPGTPPAADTNPWAKEHWNLTRQGQILRDDPAKAAQLKAAAGRH